MSIALDLARQAQGKTRPNPPVGALLVRNGRIVGQGFTQPAGHAHAEVVALNEAGKDANGADLYSTLEPCSHWGRTPPCSEALVRAGIARAHIALLDPNPQVRGQGFKCLRDAGVEVLLGELAGEAEDLVEAHAVFTAKGRPFVTLLDQSAPADVAADFMSRSDVVLSETPQGLLIPELLEQLRRDEVTSWLIFNTPELSNQLLEQHLVDKIVTSIGGEIPSGFDVRKQTDLPTPHKVLYPTTSDPHNNDSNGNSRPSRGRT